MTEARRFVIGIVLCVGVFVLFRAQPRTPGRATAVSSSSVTSSSREDALIAGAPAAQRRRSSLWVIRESSDKKRMEVLVWSEKADADVDNPPLLRLPSADSKRMEIPRVAAMRALRQCCGLEDTQVESFKQVRHGSHKVPGSEGGPMVFRDMTTYVAVVSIAKHVQTAASHADRAYSGQATARWIPLDKVSAAMQTEQDPKTRLKLSTVIRDDFASVRLFLKPFAATMGRTPVQCLGRAPPGWMPPAVINWPTSRGSTLHL